MSTHYERSTIDSFFSSVFPNYWWFQYIYVNFYLQQQQAALMAAATAQGTYINPMAALATQIPHALNGKSRF